MGQKSANRALKPQHDKKPQKKKKTLQEAASEIKEQMRENIRMEEQRKLDEVRRAQEDIVVRMIYGPYADHKDAAE